MSTASASAPGGWLRRGFARAVYALDGMLRRRLGVFEYSDDPECIFRLSRSVWDGETHSFGDGSVLRRGEAIAELHLWNQKVPLMEEAASPLAWARRMHSGVAGSLRLLAGYLAGPGDADIVAVRAQLGLATKEQTAQIERIVRRYGFEPAAQHRSQDLLERLHLLGENILVSMLVMARNPRALRRDTLRRGRLTVLMSRRSLENRYLDGPSGAKEQ